MQFEKRLVTAKRLEDLAREERGLPATVEFFEPPSVPARSITELLKLWGNPAISEPPEETATTREAHQWVVNVAAIRDRASQIHRVIKVNPALSRAEKGMYGFIYELGAHELTPAYTDLRDSGPPYTRLVLRPNSSRKSADAMIQYVRGYVAKDNPPLELDL
jgi:hypothetical protein